MTTCVWFENDAIQMDGIGTVPARSLKAVTDGDRVHVLTLSDVRLSQLVYGEYARKDGTGFASAVAAKTYLDGEFGKAVIGSPGATGPAGPKGDAGATGAKGDTGSVGATGAQGPKGDTGAIGAQGIAGQAGVQGVAGAKGDTGSQGPAGFGTVAPSTPSRVLGAAFQPSTTKATLVSYSVKTTVTNPLLAGTSTAIVTLLSDAANPPTTERCRASADSSVGLAVTIALTTANTAPLTYLVPAGHYVRLVSSTAGTGSTAIVSQTEITLG